MDQNISFLKKSGKPAVYNFPFLFYWLDANVFLHRPWNAEKILFSHIQQTVWYKIVRIVHIVFKIRIFKQMHIMIIR